MKRKMKQKKFIIHPTLTLTEAEKYLDVSRVTLWRIIRRYQINVFTDVLDQRVKRVRCADLDIVLAAANSIREGRAA